MKTQLLIKKLCFAVLALSFAVSSAQADTIAWQSSVNLFAGGNNADFISVNGTQVVGVNLGILANFTNATETANRTDGSMVSFTNADASTLGGGIAGAAGVSVSTDTFLSDAGPTTFSDGEFFGLGPGIFNLLNSASFNGGNAAAGDFAIEFSGLTIGNTYEIQVLVNDARGGANAGIRDTEWEVGFTNGVTNLVAGEADLTNRPFNDSTSPDLAGDFIIGTFTATTSTTKGFNIAGVRGGLSIGDDILCLLYTSPSPRDATLSRMPSSA